MIAAAHIGIDDYADIVCKCESVRPYWFQLAHYLKLDLATIESIEISNREPWRCLSSVLSAWLRRTSPRQPRPSWRVLCEALSHLDRGLSETIAQEHTSCQCIQCSTATLPLTGGG